MIQIEIEKKTMGQKCILSDIKLDIEEGITLIMGPSGSGKTTLLREMIPRINRVGRLEGKVCYRGTPIDEVSAGTIGYVGQNPENQLVCDKVWHELAFGLENIGMSPKAMRNRVAEIATYFGIESWFHKGIAELSGGQKQKVALASVICMDPEIIVLDEPTSQLDPISARVFWEMVVRVHEEMGISFVIVEHDSEYIYEKADNVIWLCEGTMGDYQRRFLPWQRRLLDEPQMSSKEVKKRVKKLAEETKIEITKKSVQGWQKVRNIRKAYGKENVLNIPQITIASGVNCWIGPNGAGKTTLGKMFSGFFGKKMVKRCVMMPQDVLTIFTKDTVRDELDVEDDIPEELMHMIAPIADRNPLDCSGGEQHLAASLKFLMKHADVVILDEPTKGMDPLMKDNFQKVVDMFRLKKQIIIITHDIDLVGEMADYVVFLFGGDVASEGEPHEVLMDNLVYKPQVSTMFDCINIKEIEDARVVM
ncbi:MAG: ABC transporter ATP-binding protein [Eubacterium sp.]